MEKICFINIRTEYGNAFKSMYTSRMGDNVVEIYNFDSFVSALAQNTSIHFDGFIINLIPSDLSGNLDDLEKIIYHTNPLANILYVFEYSKEIELYLIKRKSLNYSFYGNPIEIHLEKYIQNFKNLNDDYDRTNFIIRGWTIYTAERMAKMNNVEVSLSNYEVEILKHLFKRLTQPVSRKELYMVLKPHVKNNEENEDKIYRSIDVHIRNIRKKLGNNLIRSIRGLGYTLNANREL
ncbi:winged helix-turn-helix domain-containing protein [Erysipelothrix aquatica]|uniref:winged helix-turn-helix domain-containing protein n=1 Tax=Erysipelothrix aquatica TaxID=2683714 RepID=UPI00135A7795|nr:winged helix-turn-helix domain-containing protein [Erysipelothrix aquatica]